MQLLIRKRSHYEQHRFILHVIYQKLSLEFGKRYRDMIDDDKLKRSAGAARECHWIQGHSSKCSGQLPTLYRWNFQLHFFNKKVYCFIILFHRGSQVVVLVVKSVVDYPLAPCMWVHFGKFILNALVCKCDIPENNIYLVYVYVLIVFVDIHYCLRILVCFIITSGILFKLI